MEKRAIENLWQEIKTQRDELRLQVHLAANEVKEEWRYIEEKKLPEIEHKLHKLEEDYEAQIADLGKAIEIIGDEIKNSYSRIKSRLDEKSE